MTIDLSCATRWITLGFERENLARAQEFDFSAWAEEYGDGVPQLLFQRPGETTPYPVLLTVEGTTATWTPTATDTAIAGEGKGQLSYVVDEVVAKNAIFAVLISPSLGAGGTPPEPFETWLEELTELAADAQAAAISAGNAETAAETAQGLAEDARDAAADYAGDAQDAAGDAQAAQRNAEAAESAAEAAEGRAAGYANDAAGSAGTAGDAATAATNAKTAAQTAQGKAEDAQAAAVSAKNDAVAAKTAIEDMTATASVADNVPGTPSVTVTKSTVSGHENLDFVFSHVKGAKGDQGAQGVQGPTGPQGPRGYDGSDGQNGVSPTVTVTDISGGHRVTITDADHPAGQSFDVMDGDVGNIDAGDVAYDDQEEYPLDTVGAEISSVKSALSDKVDWDDAVGYGLYKNNGKLRVYSAPDSACKAGTSSTALITPQNEHSGTFYGLAKAAGDSSQRSSPNSVGNYTDSAKTAIKTMLGVTADISALQASKQNAPTAAGTDGQALTLDSNLNPVWADASISGMALKGKIVSILGDSISTYTGWIPVDDGHNITHRARYPEGTSFWHGTVDDTWWKKLIDETGAKLGINDSWAGSRVSNSSSTNTGDVGPDACMAGLTRITNLGSNGTPDVIFFYGGTNDAGNNVTLGTFDSTATYSIDLTTTIWNDFATAYKDAIMRLQYYYPMAKIIVLLPTYTSTYYQMDDLDVYNEVIKEVCDYFGVDWLDLRRCGINWANLSTTLGDGVHPTVDGFALMERYILARMSSLIRLEPGEQTVYTVTNTLGGSVNNNAYIKGVSAGEPYTATITGTFMGSVTVKMGDTDVTSTVYNSTTGAVNITAVTGNVEINDHSGTITWYSSEIDAPGTKNNSNKPGYGWAAAHYNPYPYDVPINAVRFMSSDASGVFEIGVVDQLNGTEITKVQSVSWDSSNKDANNVVTIILPETFTLRSPELLVISPNTLPTYSFKYLTGPGVTSAKYFYTRVPIVHPGGSGTAWTRAASANIFHDFGYVAE